MNRPRSWRAIFLPCLLAAFATACDHSEPADTNDQTYSMATREQQFWAWFEKNEPRFFDLESDQERLFDELNAALSQVAGDLTFEFGPKRADGKRELVVSAGGIKAAFPAVEALVAAAPSLRRWHFVKFRPRRDPINLLTIGGTTIRPQDVDCCVVSNGKELGVYLFLRGYTAAEHARWAQFGYLFLDEALGEHDVETKVGLIEFKPFDELPDVERFPLPELAGQFDQHFAQLSQK